MHKENLQEERFFTKDLATAAYLRTKGVPLEVEVLKTKFGKKGKFFYPKESQTDVDKFFKNEGNFLTYAMNMRSIKSEIQNKRGGE